MRNLVNAYRSWMIGGGEQLARDIGLLVGRLSFGGMMAIAHGLPKLQKYGAAAEKFPDPLGVGSPLSMALAIFAELFCSILVMVGLGTRLAATQLIFTMGVAAFVIHGPDPLFASGGPSKEFALVYLSGFLVLFLTGPGRFSVDRLIAERVFGREGGSA